MDTKMRKDKSKKAQVTIFIIIAILLVVGIALFFLLKGKLGIEISKPSFPNPQEYIEKCTRDATKQAIDIMLPQAGYINPENYKLYKDNKVAYLCYNQNYYYPCINQQPLYIDFLENEIKNYIEPKIKDCFYALKQDYEKRKFIIEEGALSLQVELNPKQVEILIEKKLEISKNEEARKFEKFKIKLASPLYDLAVIAQEIASQEAKFCYFEYLGYMLLYPEFSIEKKDIDGQTKIYEIKDKISEKILMIAIRSCAFPAGM